MSEKIDKAVRSLEVLHGGATEALEKADTDSENIAKLIHKQQAFEEALSAVEAVRDGRPSLYGEESPIGAEKVDELRNHSKQSRHI